MAERLARNSEPEPNSGCILWTSVILKGGYGQIVLRDPVTHRLTSSTAHRVAYETAKGPLPEGVEPDHLCRNRRCINVGHLEAVSHAVNVRRGTSAAAHRARAASSTTCRRGHPRTAENTYRRGRYRECRICTLAAKRARYADQRRRNVEGAA